MKNSYKIKTLGLALSMVAVFSGCTGDFNEINTNPNTLTEDQLDASLAGPSFASALYAGIHNGSYSSPGVDDQGTWGIATGILSSTFIQYLDCGYGTVRNDFSGFEARGWTRFYTVAVPALNNAVKAAAGDEQALAVLKIWKVFMYNQMTDAYGPIPYTEAGNGKEKVAYDSQETIYADFFKLLDESNATLTSSSSATVGLLAPNDRIYQGSSEKWRRFGNSLRLRIALRISDVDAAKAKTQAEAAVAAGVMETNDQSAYFKASNITPNNLNMIVNNWGYTMTASMESILKGYNDPRLPLWFSPIATGGYQGQPVGGLQDQFGTTKFSTFNDNVLGNGSTGTISETKNIEVFMASESYLSRAEGALNGWNMNGSAQTLYETGIKMSMAQWGITDSATINAYIAGSTLPVVPQIVTVYPSLTELLDVPVKLPVAWSSSVTDQRTQIAVQKYLAIFPESWEGWADLRRSDAKIIYPILNTDNVDAGVGKSLMKRVIYTTNEYSANKDAVTDAITKLKGPDTGGTKLWWDTK
ncbi:SusD/RagB family nutrient-binding outer membrane lipoprotein [Flavobacterium sp. MC2016-06]|uniref:SusD/RagB family nutrient-binding outer membrane lipoprotein n=1 Tax=Flavobacterium sp. MC2016-06 TaxID=2676308 RepID=UPI0012BAA16C|nr:SusD/RagB family nutrient-binding outer membrane lipoprotein [Flavobacterium sp. MC2016-06]MBU3858853.1 SusD/RagB family nutrient-binding outer membrane lipoprotein [Flavobacterium sp. MC2016-06]